MDKRWATVTILVLFLVFIGYIILDAVLKKEITPDNSTLKDSSHVSDQWVVSKVFVPGKGQLNALTVSKDGRIILGGESFIVCYDSGLNLLWEYTTDLPATALTASGSNVFAAVKGSILVLDMKGEKVEEWGPFENNSMITSLASNEGYVAFADAANKTVFILDKNGVVKSLIGETDDPFIIPSLYFDIALSSDNFLYVSNTGMRRIEKRSIDGKLLSFFGKPGTEPGAFCGCCNPAHFALIPDGFVTAEKGINRIKILNTNGEFIEFVSSVNDFVPPLPIDVATNDGKIIYGANPADSKLYVFTRK
jgi:hypothetical protein